MSESTPVSGVRPSRQKGATALEFAILFPLLFALTHGAIIYSYVFVLHQALNFTAQEAAESAVDVQPGIAGYDAAVESVIDDTVDSLISWMPANIRSTIDPDVDFCSGGGAGLECPADGGDAVVVTVALSLNPSIPIFARISLPFVGSFPPLPEQIGGRAVVRL